MIKKNKIINKQLFKVGVIGLGYVGLNLFKAINKKYNYVYGYDISKKRISDITNLNKKLVNKISYDQKIIKDCNFYIVCVPTPVFSSKNQI